MSESRHRPGLVGPAFLIGLGVILLLNNFGSLPWSIWGTILRLWPVLLVAAGLDLLLGRRSAWGSLLAIVLTLAVFGGALWLLQMNVTIGTPLPGETISQPLDDAERAELTIAPTAAAVYVTALPASSTNLLEGEIHTSRGETVEQNYALTDGTATLTLRSAGEFVGVVGVWDENQNWRLQLNRSVPLALFFDLATGSLDLDLSALAVEELNASQALGEFSVVLPEVERLQADVSMAMGSIVVTVPAGTGVRVEFDTALVGRSLEGDYRCEDDVCTSANYDSADRRIDLTIGLAIGSVTVR